MGVREFRVSAYNAASITCIRTAPGEECVNRNLPGVFQFIAISLLMSYLGDDTNKSLSGKYNFYIK